MSQILTRDNIGWNDPPGFDRSLGRMRTPSDDFFDHRKAVLERINRSMAAERRK
ncbi:hypothetical protein [Sphingomonas sp. 3-13AW]|uniref:hypothetical protein n=1 Tax=Sphingomonas sp. 3-13AW TaxID=3050450 RepID=UPI003BB66EEB